MENLIKLITFKISFNIKLSQSFLKTMTHTCFSLFFLNKRPVSTKRPPKIFLNLVS